MTATLEWFSLLIKWCLPCWVKTVKTKILLTMTSIHWSSRVTGSGYQNVGNIFSGQTFKYRIKLLKLIIPINKRMASMVVGFQMNWSIIWMFPWLWCNFWWNFLALSTSYQDLCGRRWTQLGLSFGFILADSHIPMPLPLHRSKSVHSPRQCYKIEIISEVKTLLQKRV